MPLLPTQLIEYLEAPTPYLMGVTTPVYESDDCQSVLEGVIVVQLDYDKVIVPKGVKVENFPKSFVKKMEKVFSQNIPPPSSRPDFWNSRIARILYCDSTDLMHAGYLVFEVMFGPGKMGIKMKSRQAVPGGERGEGGGGLSRERARRGHHHRGAWQEGAPAAP